MEENNLNQNVLNGAQTVGLTMSPDILTGIDMVPPVTEPIIGPAEPVTEPIIGPDVYSDRKCTLWELESKIYAIKQRLEGKDISDELNQFLENMFNQMYKKTICDITGLPETVITDDVVELFKPPKLADGFVLQRVPIYDDQVLKIVLDYLVRVKGKKEDPTINIPDGVIYSQEENTQSRSR